MPHVRASADVGIEVESTGHVMSQDYRLFCDPAAPRDVYASRPSAVYQSCRIYPSGAMDIHPPKMTLHESFRRSGEALRE